MSPLARRIAAALLLVLAAGGGALAAQDTTGVRRDSVPPPQLPDTAAPDTAAPDTIAPDTARPDAAAVSVRARGRPSPTGAFLRSLVLPGWGQAALGRKVPAALFLALEGVTLGMALKTDAELRHLRRTGSPLADEKSRAREDWFVFLVANHLLAGLEAYVSGHLVDFPDDLSLRVAPGDGGGIVGRLSLPIDLR